MTNILKKSININSSLKLIMDNYHSTITDKNNRAIEIGGNGDAIVAESNGIEIGEFTFDRMDDIIVLCNCDIDSGFQGAGIGKALFELSEEWYSNFAISNHLTTQGADFIKHLHDNAVWKYKHQIIYHEGC